jgi:transcriptional regulator with XRE-family HTH domain
MLAHWIGEIVGLMHRRGISKKQLATHLGMTPGYISMVLNGHREPAGIEDRLRKAIDEITQNME